MQQVAFRENLGQVKNQHWLPRNDVLFYGTSEGVDFFIRNNGISYQFTEVIQGPNEDPALAELAVMRNERKGPGIDTLSVYRVDVNWLGARQDFITEKGGVLPGYTNHYDVPLGHPPALEVREFAAITCHDVWDGIDLAFHARNGVLESDWIMADPDDHTKVRFQVKGAELRVDADGFLVMTTPFGSLREGRIQADQCGKSVEVHWVVEGDMVHIEVPYCEAGVPLRIDPPTRVWGTYVGNTGMDAAWDVEVDGAGGVYLAGGTASATMATTGAHQTVLSGSDSGYLAHFNGNGTRLWSTYYGGSGYDYAGSCERAPNGDVLICGLTNSTSAIATPGAFQTVKAGITESMDAFLIRFNSSGVRIWGTYFGGVYLEDAMSCDTDSEGNTYLIGSTYSKTGVATPDAHQTVAGSTNPGDEDAYVAKFDVDGVRLWSTYMGGSGIDKGLSCASDRFGNVYLSGETVSQTMIATPGSYQEELAGNQGYRDTYLVKFDPSGVRLWGTYYGGVAGEEDGYCTVDTLGQIFLVGSTNSDSVLATLGSYQDSLAGTYDAFVAKFDTDGNRQWGTYYGGALSDEAVACHADGTGSVVFSGRTKSTSGIATAGAHDQVLGGGYDAYIAKFNSEGNLHWGTYYGGGSNENGQGCTADRGNFVYMTGYTSSADQIASPGAFDTGYADGIYDMFLVKLDGCDPFPLSATAEAATICEEDSSLLIVSGALSYVWSPSPSLSTWTGDSIQAYPNVTTTYSVTGMDQWGCEAQSGVVLNVVIVDTTIVMDDATLTVLQTGAQYQWVDCNNAFAPFPDATGQSFTPGQSGAYAAVVALGNCVDTTSCRTIVLTSIATSVTEQFRLFPNPADERAFYFFDGTGDHLLQILDASGRVVHFEVILAPQQGTIELRDLATGVYTVILSGERVWRKQLCVGPH